MLWDGGKGGAVEFGGLTGRTNVMFTFLQLRFSVSRVYSPREIGVRGVAA